MFCFVIFSSLERINSKLDKGNYQKKLDDEEYGHERYVYKKYDHDKKEKYLDEKK